MQPEVKDRTSNNYESANNKTEILLLMLIGIVILLLITNIGLFLRVSDLQQKVIEALALPQSLVGTQPMGDSSMGLKPGTESHNFELPDTSGKTVSLRDFSGRKVLLAFFSTECTKCIQTYPVIKSFSEKRNDIQVIMILRGSSEKNRQVTQEHDFSFPVLEWNDGVAGEYQVPGTPFYYVIDGKGSIANAGFAGSAEELDLLAGN
jgi:peroxiredoxin